MTKRSLACLAAVLGLACLALRAYVWSAIYDPETQLARPSPLGGAFAAVVAVCALLLCLLDGRMRRAAGGAGVRPLDGPGRALSLAAGVLSGAAGAVSLVSLGAEAVLEPITAVLAILLLLQGAVLWYLTLVREEGAVYTGLLLLPPLTACYWLVSFYHTYGATPGTETYLWPMAAGLVICAAWLQYAGGPFREKPSRAPGLPYLLVLLLVPPALAAPVTLPLRLSLAAQFAWFLAAAGQLQYAPARRAAPAAK